MRVRRLGPRPRVNKDYGVAREVLSGIGEVRLFCPFYSLYTYTLFKWMYEPLLSY